MGALWNAFVDLLKAGLVFTAGWTGSLGWSIVLFTIFLRLLTLPLTFQSLRSSRKMQELQPKLQALQKKYKNDKEKLTEETLKLYREHGVNPVGGCLPMLLQLPFFFGFYYAVIALSRDPAFAKQGFLWLQNLGEPDPYKILPILAGAIQLLQQQMMMPAEKAKTKEGAQQEAMNQAMMVMPLMIVFFGWNFASGAVIYWVTSSLVGIVQQFFMTGWGGLVRWFPFLRRIPAPALAGAPVAAAPAPDPEGREEAATPRRRRKKRRG